MTKTKRYERTIFTVFHLRDAITSVGTELTVRSAEITADDVTVSFNSVHEFLETYAKGCASAAVSVESESCIIRFHIFSNTSIATVESENTSLVDRTFSLLDDCSSSAQVGEEHSAFKGFDVERFCVVSPLHWASLPLLPSHLAKYGFTITEQSVSITRHPTTVRYTEWEPVLADIRQNGEPKRFVVNFRSKPNANSFSLTVRKSKYNDCDEGYILLDVSGVHTMDIVDDIAAFLALQADEVQPRRKVDRTAFIAHRFDELGEQLADRLARFLSLLGFEVQTGRGFSPKPVSAKVKERLNLQSIVFAILTPGDDATWLTQESVIGLAGDKPLFVLRDTNADFRPGILGDLEFVPFTAPKIEAAFVPILEGLKELGFLSFTGG